MKVSIWLICRDYGSEGLKPIAAYTDRDAAFAAWDLLATGIERHAMFIAPDGNPLIEPFEVS